MKGRRLEATGNTIYCYNVKEFYLASASVSGSYLCTCTLMSLSKHIA